MINMLVCNNIVPLFISITLIIIGLILMAYKIWVIYKNNMTKYWPKAKGTILDSKLITKYKETKDTFKYRYKADVKYKYNINGNEYISNRVYFDDNVYRHYPYRAKKTIKKYVAGKKVNVYYNPLDYEEAVLEVGIKPENLLSLTIAIVLIILGVIIIKEPILFMKLLDVN